MSQVINSDVATLVAIAVLGPLEVSVAGRSETLPSPKERALLAHLAARVGQTVTTDALIETLWGDEPPRTAGKALQNHVVHLRRVLEPEHDRTPKVLVTDSSGYRLALPAEAVDANRFEHLAHLGRRAYQEGRQHAAAQTLRSALALWRGEAYLGMESTSIGSREARRLDELRLLALEDCMAAELESGHAREVVPEIEALLPDHPLRERLWLLLVLALYRAGRQGEALAAYARAREIFVDELGVEPGKELRRLHAQVLAQDAALDGPSAGAMLPAALTPPTGAFVGRSNELERLHTAWGRVLTSGLRAVAVVRGPAESGVSRLVAEFAAALADEGVSVRLTAEGAELADPDPGSAPTSDVFRSSAHLLVVHDSRTGAGADALPIPTEPADLLVVLARPDNPLTGDLVLELGPLGASDVLTLLAEYVDPEAARSALDEVLRVSSGWPGRVHEAALRLAKDHATARVRGAVARTEVVQQQLDEARADIREGVTAFRQAAEHAERPHPDECPWMGLAPYDTGDAAWFVGRERLVAETLTRVASQRFVSVVGASGSGKSSLIRAGLLAGLDSGALPGSQGWTLRIMRPGPHPMRELVRIALSRGDPSTDRVADLLQQAVFGGDPGERAVIVVDQFEELWTVCHDPAEREAFISALLGLIESDTPATIVVALRADHVSHLGDHPELARATADSTLLIGSPTATELRRAVEGPAARAGLLLDVGLADALVDDALGSPGALPLLSTSLTELWARRQGRHLTLAAYTGAGGLKAAVSRLAERAYGELSEADQHATRILLLRLAGAGEGDTVTRRRVPLGDLETLPNKRVIAVVDPLAAARLLTVDAGTVEVAHEALFREWPRLRGWLEEQATTQVVRRRLAAAAADWDAAGRETAEVWQGTRLEAGLELAAAVPDEITATEKDFLAVGRDRVDAERRDSEERAATTGRQNRRLRWLLGGVALLLVSASVAGSLAVRAEQSARRAEDQALSAATVATSRELAAASGATLQGDPELSLLLGIRAIETTRSVDGSVLPQAEEALHRAVTASRVVASFSGVGGSLAVSSSGNYFVPEGPEGSGRVEIRDATTGELIRSWVGHDVDLNEAAVSGDGSVVATSGDDGAAVAWDPGTGRELGRIRIRAQSPVLFSPQLSADGSVLAVASEEPSNVVVRQLETGTTRAFNDVDHGPALALSPDGTQIALADVPGRVGIFDVASGRLLFRLAGDDTYPAKIAWSPNGRWLLAAVDSDARIWDARTGDLTATLAANPSDPPVVRWSPNSHLVAVTGRDGVIRVWRVDDAGAEPLGTYASAGSRDGTFGLGFSADSQRLFTGSMDTEGRVTVFDITSAGSAEVVTVATPQDWTALAMDPDGSRLYVSSPTHAARFIDPSTGRSLGVIGPRLPRDSSMLTIARHLAVSPDGTLLATASFSGVAVWDIDSGRQVFLHANEEDWWPMAPSWSPGGDLLAVSGFADGHTDLLSVDGRVVGTVSEDPGFSSIAATFSNDARYVATGRRPVGAQLGSWGVTLTERATGETIWTVDAQAERLAFLPDGDLVIVGTQGPILVVDGATGQTVATLAGHVGGAISLALSPDGTTLATGGLDQLVRLWDTTTWTQRIALQGHTGEISGLAFTPDGRSLASISADGTTRLWALDVDDLLAIARSKLTRPLTDLECAQYLHQVPC